MFVSSAVSSPLAPGYRLDRYELVCPVGQGGMAAVWLARLRGKHGFQKLVAVKTILPLFTDDAQFRQMFLDEATIASRIDHGNVAQILDLGEHAGILYLVMEWVDGDSVTRLERDAQQASVDIPLSIALRIASDCCAGLHAAHELCDARGHSLGVVHRDVSPQNVLVTGTGQVKLIDFGIAKARTRATDETCAGVFKGKLHYIAPEQASGKVLDRRADIWAVGAMLYRLLAQRTVYDAGNHLDTLRELTSNAPLAPLPPHVSGRIASIVYKSLAFDPADRYATCAELQNELDKALAAESLAVSPSELGVFATTFLGERLEARRKLISASLQSLSERNGISIEGTLGDAEYTVARPHALSSELSSKAARPRTPRTHGASLTTNSTPVSDQLVAPRSRRVWGAAALTALSVVAALLVFWLRAARSDQTQPLAPSARVSAEPVAVPVPLPAPTEPEMSAVVPPKTPAPPSNQAHVISPSAHPKPKRKIIDDGF